MRLDGHGYSPAVLRLIVTAAARLGSFADAAFAVSLTGLSISARHVQELTQQIGGELADARDQQAQQHRRRQLPPRVASTPAVVAVEVDGGRLRTRAPEHGRGVHAAANKEDKLACLVTLQSTVHASDPQAEPPPAFLQPRRVQRLVQQVAGHATDPGPDPQPLPAVLLAAPEAAAVAAETGATAADAAAVDETAADEAAAAVVPRRAAADPAALPWAPKRLLRSCVASMVNRRAFGPLVAAEAQARDFYAAPRRAFVADGQAYNWTIQRGYFQDFEPIVDFVHLVCYLFSTAWAVGPAGGRWPLYVRWVTACWQGQAAAVLGELNRYQEQVGRAPPGEEVAASDPRRVLAATVSYLENNQSRMDYPRYRQQGLPTTSSLVESLVGEFNARVKGKHKFWNRPSGAEAILQVRAAYLSEDGRLERHLEQRPGNPYRRRQAA